MAGEFDLSEKETLIGYLSVLEEPSNNSYSQVLFIVDVNGYPVDYSYTDNIHVDEVQRILFGSTLRRYLITEIFGIHLLENIKEPPSILFVDSEDLLIIRDKIEIPVFYVDSEKGYNNKEKELVTHEQYSSDKEQAKSILETCIQNFEISEPFSRIINAVSNKQGS